jgi:hypothetical protein
MYGWPYGVASAYAELPDGLYYSESQQAWVAADGKPVFGPLGQDLVEAQTQQMQQIALADTVCVTFEEGGEWVPFDQIRRKSSGSPKGRQIHAIRYADGSEWDAYNGWRTVKI